jgi:hypothetical protein
LTSFALLARDDEALFDDKIHNPSKAVLLHYLNSGCFAFQRWKDYGDDYAGQLMSEADKQLLNEEILSEMLTDRELEQLVNKFLSCHSYNEPRLPSCGACGTHQWERPASPVVQYTRLV